MKYIYTGLFLNKYLDNKLQYKESLTQEVLTNGN